MQAKCVAKKRVHSEVKKDDEDWYDRGAPFGLFSLSSVSATLIFWTGLV